MAERDAGRIPGPHGGHDLADHRLADLESQPRVGKAGGDLARKPHALLRMAPPQQRLEAGHLPRIEVDLGLVMRADLPSPQRFPAQGEHRHVSLHLGSHRRSEDRIAALALPLGCIKCEIGVLHQLRSGLSVEREEARAYTGMTVE